MNKSTDENRRPLRRLPRAFSLKRQSLIRPLFDPRRDDVGTITKGCVRIVYRQVPREAVPDDVPVLVGFAPGRIRKAVRRNRIKRLLREVYRVHQEALVDLFSDRDVTLTMMIVYRRKEDEDPPAGAGIRKDLPEALAELHGRLGETSVSRERRV